jgi:hypothetical protein
MTAVASKIGELTLGDLYFGMRDALDEGEGGADSLEFFLSSFTTPQGIDVEDYVSGKKFFIRGRKGTGKTALLRYIAQHSLNPKAEGYKLILFTQIGDAEKARLIRGTHLQDQPSITDVGSDVAHAWTVYLHRELARLLDERRDLIESSQPLDDYIRSATAFFDDGTGSSALKIFFERLKGGYIEIPAIAKLGLRIAEQKRRVMLADVVRQLDALLAKIVLKPGARLFLLIDELNPSSTSSEARAKDFILVRHLVIAVHSFNRMLRRQRGSAIVAICAVRSEVMLLVDPTGSEIARKLHDNGDEITWRKRNPGDPWREAPIIKLVRNKIWAAEKKKFGRHRTDEQVWVTYFPDEIFRLEPQRFIYQSTWARPRDLVQLLQTAADKSKGAKKFHDDVFKRVQTDTQKEFWTERVEELRLSYSDIEIAALERCLTAFQREFSIVQFRTHVEKLSNDDGEIKDVVEKYNLQPILRDLYIAGVLGNKDDRGNEFWEYEFDANPNFTNSFIVHRGLLIQLRLVR